MGCRYSVTTFDPQASSWCGHARAWLGRDDRHLSHRSSSHRYFRTLRQALSHAAVLVLRGIADVCVLESGRSRREWLLSTTKPGDGIEVESSVAWARAYLAMPRRKR